MSKWKRVKLDEVAKMMCGRTVSRSSIIPSDILVMLGGRNAAIANCRKQIELLEEAVLELYRERFGDEKGQFPRNLYVISA